MMRLNISEIIALFSVNVIQKFSKRLKFNFPKNSNKHPVFLEYADF